MYSWAPRWRGSSAIARLVVPEGGVELLQIAVRVAEVVLQVGVIGVAHLGFSQPRDRLLPLFGDDGLPRGRVILVGGGEVGIGLRGLGVGRQGRSGQRPYGQQDRGDPHRCATYAFARVSSGRLPSLCFESSMSFA
jgi:hypothetical protein